MVRRSPSVVVRRSLGVVVRRSPSVVVRRCGGKAQFRAQELCESRGGRLGLPSLISLRFLWTKSSTEQHGARTDLLQRNNVTVNFRHVGVSFVVVVVVVVVVYRVRGATSSSAIAAEHGNTGGYRTNLCFPFRAAVFVRLFIRFKSLHCLLPVLSCV